MENITRPALSEGPARDCPYSARFARARCHDARRSPPATPKPSARPPTRVQASAHVVRPHAVVRLLAEIVAV
eukprot:14209685-Alexandrium_andersonii.AAC.1